MQILYGIGIYMLVSSFLMIAYVWFRYIRHNQSEYKKISKANNLQVQKEQLSGENLAA